MRTYAASPDGRPVVLEVADGLLVVDADRDVLSQPLVLEVDSDRLRLLADALRGYREWVSPSGVRHAVDLKGRCMTCGKPHDV